jgi:hypothetical protein
MPTVSEFLKMDTEKFTASPALPLNQRNGVIFCIEVLERSAVKAIASGGCHALSILIDVIVSEPATALSLNNVTRSFFPFRASA